MGSDVFWYFLFFFWIFCFSVWIGFPFIFHWFSWIFLTFPCFYCFSFIFLTFPCFPLVFIVFSLVFLHFPHFFLVFHWFSLFSHWFSFIFLTFYLFSIGSHWFFIGFPSCSSFFCCFPLVFLSFSLAFQHFPHLVLDLQKLSLVFPWFSLFPCFPVCFLSFPFVRVCRLFFTSASEKCLDTASKRKHRQSTKGRKMSEGSKKNIPDQTK